MRRPLLLLLLPAVVLLAGCTAPAPTPVTTASSSTPAPSITPLAEPTPLPGEIARGEIGPTTRSSGRGTVPRSARRVYVHAGCSGPAGSTMHYELRDAGGRRFGPSADIPCGGGPSTAGSAIAGDRGTRATVLVTGSDGVVGSAVLTTSAAR